MEEVQQERNVQMRCEEWEFHLQMFHMLAAPSYQNGPPRYVSQTSVRFSQQRLDNQLWGHGNQIHGFSDI